MSFSGRAPYDLGEAPHKGDSATTYHRHATTQGHGGGWWSHRAVFVHTPPRLVGTVDITWRPARQGNDTTAAQPAVWEGAMSCSDVAKEGDAADPHGASVYIAREFYGDVRPYGVTAQVSGESDGERSQSGLEYSHRKAAEKLASTRLGSSTMGGTVALATYENDFPALTRDTLGRLATDSTVGECRVVLMPHFTTSPNGKGRHPSSLWLQHRYTTASSWTDLTHWVLGTTMVPLTVYLPERGQPLQTQLDLRANQIVLPLNCAFLSRLAYMVHMAATADSFRLSIVLEQPLPDTAPRKDWTMVVRYTETRRYDAYEQGLAYVMYWTCPRVRRPVSTVANEQPEHGDVVLEHMRM